MADLSNVKVYFLEQFSTNDYVGYYNTEVVPVGFKVLQVDNVSGNLISFAVPHGLYPDNFITPAPMMLNIELNQPGAPASRAVRVVNATNIELLSPLEGVVQGQSIMIFKWVDRSGLLASGSLSISRSDDHRDRADFSILTTANGFFPYTGMNVLIKYGSGNTLFGGIVKSASAGVYGKYNGTATELRIRVSCDSYAALAKRRVTMINGQWTNTRADTIVRWVLEYLKQEGVTEGLIGEGLWFERFPNEKSGAYSLLNILDKAAELSGYVWYINNDKGLFFVPKEAIYDPDSEEWQPVISDAPFNLEDNGSFDDYSEVELDMAIDMYCNTVHLEGGEDIYKHEAYAMGRDDGQIRLTQYRTAGSGVWGAKIEEDNVRSLIQETVEAGSGGTTLVITTHELQAGDYLFKMPYYTPSSRVKTVIDSNTVELYNSIGAESGSIIGYYRQANAMIRNRLKNYGSAIPKEIRFATYTMENEQGKIWAPGQRVQVALIGFGAGGTGNFVTSGVSYADVGGEIKINVAALLRDPSFFE